MADDLWGQTTARGVYDKNLSYYNFEDGTPGDKIQREAAKGELAKALSASYGTKDSTGRSLAAPSPTASPATGLMGMGAKPDTSYADKAGAYAGDMIGGMAPSRSQPAGPMDDSGMYSGIAPGLFDPARVSSMEPLYSTATVAPSFTPGPMQIEQAAQAVAQATPQQAPAFDSAPIDVGPGPAVADVGSGGSYDSGTGGGLVSALDTNNYAVDPLTGGTYNPSANYQVDPLTGATFDGNAGGYQGGITGGQQAQQGSFDPWGGAYGSGA